MFGRRLQLPPSPLAMPLKVKYRPLKDNPTDYTSRHPLSMTHSTAQSIRRVRLVYTGLSHVATFIEIEGGTDG